MLVFYGKYTKRRHENNKDTDNRIFEKRKTDKKD